MGMRDIAAMPTDACHLQRMLIVKDVIKLLRIGRAARRYRDVDRMEISYVHIHHTAVRKARPATSR